MIVRENEYRQFLANNNVGRNDRVPGRTINSYVSRLNGISEKIGKSISPQLFDGNFNVQGFRDAWARIEAVVHNDYTPNALRDCKSNFKRYWEMLCANEKLR